MTLFCSEEKGLWRDEWEAGHQFGSSRRCRCSPNVCGQGKVVWQGRYEAVEEGHLGSR